MSLRNLISFYVNNYSRLNNPKIFRSRILDEYKNTKLRKEKLKLGAIVFTLCEFRYDGVLLKYWFDVIYINQASSEYSRALNHFKKMADFWKWSWDFSNICSLTFLLTIFYDIIATNVNLFIERSTKLSEDEIEHNMGILKNSYNLLDFKSFSPSTDFCENFIQISDIIFKISDYNHFLPL